MNKPSLVAGKGWHFVRTFFVVGILSVPFFGLDFVRTISTCFGILSYHRWEKWIFLCSKQHGFQSFEKNYDDDSLNITQMHFRLLVVLVTKSTVSICSHKVTWWFYGYLNDGWWQNCWNIEGRWWWCWWWWWWWWWTLHLLLACPLKPCSVSSA